MGNLFRMFRRLYTKYLSWSLPIIWWITDWWLSRQLDKAVDGEMTYTTPDWIVSLSGTVDTMSPYVITFLFTGILFSVPEWLPYAKKLKTRVGGLLFKVKRCQSDKHNVTVFEAIHYVASNKWDNIRKVIDIDSDAILSDSDISKLESAWKTVRQWGIDADIRIWGLNDRDEWIEINEPSYWQRHWLNWTQIMVSDTENDWGLDDLLGSDWQTRKDDLYHVYSTSKQDIEKLWR